MLEKVYLNRYNEEAKQTLGELVYNGIVVAKTLELPWRNNERKVSCIARGTYRVIRRYNVKFGHHFWLPQVKDRDMILIHHGNYHFNILGCILAGEQHIDINQDGYRDVTASKPTMRKLVRLLPYEFEIIIN